jgi:hypothetical protein
MHGAAFRWKDYRIDGPNGGDATSNPEVHGVADHVTGRSTVSSDIPIGAAASARVFLDVGRAKTE